MAEDKTQIVGFVRTAADEITAPVDDVAIFEMHFRHGGDTYQFPIIITYGIDSQLSIEAIGAPPRKRPLEIREIIGQNIMFEKRTPFSLYGCKFFVGGQKASFIAYPAND